MLAAQAGAASSHPERVRPEWGEEKQSASWRRSRSQWGLQVVMLESCGSWDRVREQIETLMAA